MAGKGALFILIDSYRGSRKRTITIPFGYFYLENVESIGTSSFSIQMNQTKSASKLLRLQRKLFY